MRKTIDDSRSFFVTKKTLKDLVQKLIDNNELDFSTAIATTIGDDPKKKVGVINIDGDQGSWFLRGCSVVVGQPGEDIRVITVTWLIPYANNRYSFNAWGQTSTGSVVALTWGVIDDNTKTPSSILIYVPTAVRYLYFVADGDN